MHIKKIKRFNKITSVVLMGIGLNLNCSDPIRITEFEPEKKLIISEIMYNNDSDSLEYIEIKNNSHKMINLKDYKVTDGVEYKFGDTMINAGDYMVLTNSRDLFTKKYPGIPVAGIFNGRLNDDGEKISIEDNNFKEIIDVEYGDGEFWPALADGLGYSLVTISEFDPGDQNDHNDWRASASKSGSPGAKDADLGMKAAFVNEVITTELSERIDSIEIYNPDSTQALDLSGWYLTDNKKIPAKYQIPAGTVLQPNSYAIFSSEQFGKALTVSAAGGEIYLFSASLNGSFTGYSHGIKFNKSYAGSSFGLIKNSDSKYFCFQLTESSIGEPNGLPFVGPVVISEIMYNPSSGTPEFVEISNITDSPQYLSDEIGRWKLGGISFDFPAGTQLAPGALLLLADTTVEIDSFRKMRNIDSSVQIFHFNGKLSNSGERIALEKPVGTWVDSNGFINISYAPIDMVAYSDDAPWPEGADGDGYSLQRISLSAWGSEPMNWTKSVQIGGTPGKN